ncbi:MAG: ubiX [Rhodospirillales bacterium]|nr:ubiX [Rhodospirillales bacterium]
MASGGKRRIILGISGASGACYGVRLLDALNEAGLETHLVISKAAETTLQHELALRGADLRSRAACAYQAGDMAAAISSGSFRTMGMIVAPCSMRSLAEIAGGATTGLLTRAADVVLKERRRLVLLVRETPLHTGHLRSMLQASEIGAIIMPPVPAFYAKPQSVEAIIDHTVGRVLDLFEIDNDLPARWGETTPT